MLLVWYLFYGGFLFNKSVFMLFLLSSFAFSTSQITLTLLDEFETGLENSMQSFYIEKCCVKDSSYSLILSRPVYTDDISVIRDYWNISFDEVTCEVIAVELNPPDLILFYSVCSDETYEMLLIASSPSGDTLWSCPLEGTSDFDNDPVIFALKDNDLIVYNKPDCFDISSKLQRISQSGEKLWCLYLTTAYLLDIPEERAELSPRVNSVRELPSGDILITGSVKAWLNNVTGWFVCLLDGETGEVIWKNTGTGLGAAALFDGSMVSSDVIITIGSTAEAVTPPDMNYSIWGDQKSMMLFFDADGLLFDSLIGGSELNTGEIFIGNILVDDEFFIIGSDLSSNTMKLNKYRITL